MMLWWCYDDVMMMLWLCYDDVMMMLWLCYDYVMMMLWWCYDDVMMMLWWCYDYVWLCYDYVMIMFVYVGPFQSLFTDLPFGKRVSLEKRTGLGKWFCEWKWQSDGEMSAGCWKMQHHDKGQLRVSILTSWSLIIIILFIDYYPTEYRT